MLFEISVFIRIGLEGERQRCLIRPIRRQLSRRLQGFPEIQAPLQGESFKRTFELPLHRLHQVPRKETAVHQEFHIGKLSGIRKELQDDPVRRILFLKLPQGFLQGAKQTLRDFDLLLSPGKRLKICP